MISRLAGPRFRVRLEIPRTGGRREWGAAAGAFEQRLEGQASATVTGPRIESEMRRGRDYVRVAMSVTVDAADIAQAAAVAWSVVQQAAAADVSAWDMAGASAEIRPAERALTPRRQGPPGGRSLRFSSLASIHQSVPLPGTRCLMAWAAAWLQLRGGGRPRSTLGSGPYRRQRRYTAERPAGEPPHRGCLHYSRRPGRPIRRAGPRARPRSPPARPPPGRARLG
jgi:hypothetical protein